MGVTQTVQNACPYTNRNAADNESAITALSSGDALIITGASVPVVWFLLPVGIGITVYGVTYAIVHDLAIHRRLGPFRPRGRVVEYLSTAHAEHHRANGAPYGMLWPVMARVPQSRG